MQWNIWNMNSKINVMVTLITMIMACMIGVCCCMIGVICSYHGVIFVHGISKSKKQIIVNDVEELEYLQV